MIKKRLRLLSITLCLAIMFSIISGCNKTPASSSNESLASSSINSSQGNTSQIDYKDVEPEVYSPSISTSMNGVLDVDANSIINESIIGGGVNFAFSDYVYYDFINNSGFNYHLPGLGIKKTVDARWDDYFKMIDFTGMQYVRLQVNYTQWEPINDNNDPKVTDFDKGYIFSPNFKSRPEAAGVPGNTFVYMQQLYRLLDYFEEKGLYVVLGNWNFTSSGSLGFCPDGKNWLAEDDKNFKDEFSETFAAIMYHLIEEKGYSCVKGFSIYNEPEHLVNYEATLTSIYNKCGEQLTRLGIKDRVLIQSYDGPILWSAENPSAGSKTLENMLENCGDNMDILSLHHYISTIESGKVGDGIQGTISSRLINDFVKPILAIADGRPLVLGELGTFAYCDDTKNTEYSSKDVRLPIFNAEAATAIFNTGVKGYGLWNYNCHLHNYFAMIEPDKKNVLNLIPDSTNFYPSSLMIKYLPKGTNIVQNEITGGTLEDIQRVFATVGTLNGQTTILLVNDSEEPAKISINGVDSTKTYNQHYVCKGMTDRIYPGEAMQLTNGTSISLRPQSITVLTTYTHGTQTVR